MQTLSIIALATKRQTYLPLLQKSIQILIPKAYGSALKKSKKFGILVCRLLQEFVNLENTQNKIIAEVLRNVPSPSSSSRWACRVSSHSQSTQPLVRPLLPRCLHLRAGQHLLSHHEPSPSPL